MDAWRRYDAFVIRHDAPHVPRATPRRLDVAAQVEIESNR